jgi:hypothetical protein
MPGDPIREAGRSRVGAVRREGNVGNVDDLSTPKRTTGGGDLACLCVACARISSFNHPGELDLRLAFAEISLSPGCAQEI